MNDLQAGHTNLQNGSENPTFKLIDYDGEVMLRILPWEGQQSLDCFLLFLF